MFSIIQFKPFCNSQCGSFWRFCRSLFQKCQAGELSSHPFSVNSSFSAARAKHILLLISMVQFWLKLSLYWVCPKVSTAPTTLLPSCPFMWLWIAFLSLTSCETVLLECITTDVIPACVSIKNSSKLLSDVVAIFILKMAEHKEQFWHMRLCHFKKGESTSGMPK